MVVDADLVKFGRIDAIEPVGRVGELDRVAVPDRGVRGPAWAHRQQDCEG